MNTGRHARSAFAALLTISAICVTPASLASTYSVRAVTESGTDNGTDGFAFATHQSNQYESGTAIASAANGQLRAASGATAYPIPFDSSATVITESEATAVMNLTGFFISGAGSSVPASFNMLLTGNVSATSGGSASVSVRADLSAPGIPPMPTTVLGGFGGTVSESSGVRESTGIFSSIALGSSTMLVSNPVTMPVNMPLVLSVSLRTFTRTFERGSDPQLVEAFANFENTLTFPMHGPVFNLPPGYTLNSLDGLFVDNRFSLVPLGPGWMFLGTGLLFMISRMRRASLPSASLS